MKKFSIILVVCLCIPFAKAKAQTRELGNVTVAELQEKFHPKDTSAVAAVLFSVGKTYFEYYQETGFRMLTEVTRKIKIYKKDGYQYANAEVPFYIRSTPEDIVTFSKAVTYNLVNGQVEKTKLLKEGEFVVKNNKFYSTKRIAMPNVKEGSIVEYTYVIRSDRNHFTFPDWDFQWQIPVDYSEYTTIIPQYLTYNTFRKGSLNPIETTDLLNKVITLKFKEDYENNSTVGSLRARETSTEKIDYKATKKIYILKDIPAIQNEVYINNLDNYTTGLKHELSATNFPNRVFENFSETWQSVVTKIYELEDFGGELKKTSYFENDIKNLVAGKTDPIERTFLIFRNLQNHMTWNGYKGIFASDGVKKAYDNKSGNVAEINLMLVAMLRNQGIDANPVLISTRDHGIPVYPTINGFNYVVVAVEIDKKMYLLDASNKFAMPNVLPTIALNWIGKLIRDDKTFVDVDLEPSFNSKEYNTITADIDAQGKITGKVKHQLLDYNGFVFRNADAKLQKDIYLEKLEKSLNNIEIADYEVLNKSDLSKPIIETFSFIDKKSIEKIGDKLYISPLLFLTETKNPFVNPTREFPIDFMYPNREQYSVNINIPAGYIVESAPKTKIFQFVDKLASFKFIVEQVDNQIQIAITSDINAAIIAADYYTDLKIYFAEIIKTESEKIILVRK